MARVLLAEDDPDIRHLVTYKLTRAGMDIVGVPDGLAALQAARRNPPDAALLDVRIPRMSGLDVCRELRAAPPTALIPIIMLTARARQQDLEAAYAAGATDYVVKPFSPRDLLTRVQAALARVRT
jgi:two-component system, OmpR family, phosphate regulon response regulator PhoB